MQIKVTAADIRKGKPTDIRECPVARAVSRVRPDAYVMVTGLDIYIDEECYIPPDAVGEFIDAFDLGEPVVPFTFELS